METYLNKMMDGEPLSFKINFPLPLKWYSLYTFCHVVTLCSWNSPHSKTYIRDSWRLRWLRNTRCMATNPWCRFPRRGMVSSAASAASSEGTSWRNSAAARYTPPWSESSLCRKVRSTTSVNTMVPLSPRLWWRGVFVDWWYRVIFGGGWNFVGKNCKIFFFCFK